jgi:hypothetical protein
LISLERFGLLNISGFRQRRKNMATQIVMDHHGDTRHVFDENDSDALALAEERFMKLVGQGYTAAVRGRTGMHEVTRSFDPKARETLFYPRLVGG